MENLDLSRRSEILDVREDSLFPVSATIHVVALNSGANRVPTAPSRIFALPAFIKRTIATVESE